MEVGEVELMKYSMKNIDERARKILGFDKEERIYESSKILTLYRKNIPS